MAADLFDAAGEKWIVLVDRYSGYAWTDKLKDTSTATVTAKLNSWSVEYGYPEYIRYAQTAVHNSEETSKLTATSIAFIMSEPRRTTQSQTA